MATPREWAAAILGGGFSIAPESLRRAMDAADARIRRWTPFAGGVQWHTGSLSDPIWYVSEAWKDIDGIHAKCFHKGRTLVTSPRFETQREAMLWAESYPEPARRKEPPLPRTSWKRILDADD